MDRFWLKPLIATIGVSAVLVQMRMQRRRQAPHERKFLDRAKELNRLMKRDPVAGERLMRELADELHAGEVHHRAQLRLRAQSDPKARQELRKRLANELASSLQFHEQLGNDPAAPSTAEGEAELSRVESELRREIESLDRMDQRS
jgi:hypothetical protein